MVALARSASEPDRAERRRRGIAGRGPVADATAALDGRLVGAPAIQDRSRFGLDRELGCRAISQGTRQPEWTDRQDDEMRRARPQCRTIESTARPVVLDDHIRVSHEVEYCRVIWAADDRA